MQTKKLSSATKPSHVVVETKKVSDSCCSEPYSNCSKVSHVIMMVLLIINTVFLVLSFSMLRNNEASKVGGRENYNMAKQIYKTDGFKAYQKQQIQQALQMFEGGAGGATAPQGDLNLPAVDAQSGTPDPIESTK